ncbi:MAG: transcription termination factor Rho [Chloroflexota bacterium]
MNVSDLADRTMVDLRNLARTLDLTGVSTLRKHELVERLLAVHAAEEPTPAPPAFAPVEVPNTPMPDPAPVALESGMDAANLALAVTDNDGRTGTSHPANGDAHWHASEAPTVAVAEPENARAEILPPVTVRPVEPPEEHVFAHGVLDVAEAGHGFLRPYRFMPGPDDVYVSQSQIRRFALRTGDMISGQVRPPKDNERYFSLLRVEAVNGQDPDTATRRPHFENLTPIFPQEAFNLETSQQNLSQRLINLVAPIGRGQRGLIVSPPKAGKTMLLKQIANGIIANHPDIHLMVALIGERPEEVTDMKRSVQGEVVSSTFDEDTENHTRVAEMALERAKRLVEAGRDVVILLDSITRLVRAYNLAVPPSGRTLSGGVDPSALYPPKRFFGAARNLEEGGSLTIIATCLIDTGSRMDEVVYEEFKGTGNLEIHLERRLAERRVYPSVDILRSSTRREELLLDEATLRQVWMMRRMLTQIGEGGFESLLRTMSKTANNREFLRSLAKDSL